MAEKTDRKIKAKDIVGLKYFDQLGELLQQLHDVGCERDRAGNRSLHMEQERRSHPETTDAVGHDKQRWYSESIIRAHASISGLRANMGLSSTFKIISRRIIVISA